MIKFIRDNAFVCSCAAAMLIGSTFAHFSNNNDTVDVQEVGMQHVRTVEQQFGNVSVLTAEMSRDTDTTYKSYIYIEIEGMPCVQRNQGHQGGISCDWTKWKGKTFDEAIAPVAPVYKAPVKVELPFFAKQLLDEDEYPNNVVSKDSPKASPYAPGMQLMNK